MTSLFYTQTTHTLTSPTQADGPKGQFAIDKMKIVEPMAESTFGKDYPYAIQVRERTYNLIMSHLSLWSCFSMYVTNNLL